MRALRVIATAALAACNGTTFETVSSSVEAGAPPTPVFQRILTDDVTGDNAPVVVSGTSANCSMGQPCFIADPDADVYTNDLFERPAGKGSLARNYAPAIDIVSGQAGLTSQWIYYRVNVFGPQPGQTTGSSAAMPFHYGIEINFDDDAQGDVIIDVDNTTLATTVNWGTTGIIVKADDNETMGGPRPLLPDGPGNGGGYEHMYFDGGLNTASQRPGGTTAVQARINGNALELAVFRPFLASLTSDTITAIAFRPYADANPVDTNQLYTHDIQPRNGVGSPYPWLRVAGAPATCPGTETGLTAAQILALDSGTNVNTGILNPCYAVGSVYLRDNAGTVSDLASKDDLQVQVDLSLVKSDAADPVSPGDPIVYTLTVTNNSTGIVTGATIEDTLPLNVTFLSASPTCAYNPINRTVTCNLPALPAASVTSVTITVLSTTGNVNNTATVTSNGDELTPANNIDSETTTVMLLCGNGQVNAGEVCDDGNGTNGDGCNNDCRRSNGEPCTIDNQCSSGVCDPTSMTCEPANTCGNGELEPANNEVCDDGNTAPNDGCESDCRLSNGQGCTMDSQCASGECNEQTGLCVPAIGCGNGVLNAGEICDDGNTINGDGCETTCRRTDGQPCTMDNQCHSGVCDPDSGTCEPANVCGNGEVENAEVCDDGNSTDGDGCNTDCKLSDTEECDDDTDCSSGVCDPDSDTCEPANVCGNGATEGAEICDDGNSTDGDGCNTDCKLSDTEECDDDDDCSSGVCDNGVCEPALVCGNGVVEGDEGCDDGNTASGDGCTSACKVEDGEPCVDDDDCESGVCDPQTNVCGGEDTDGDGIFDATDIDDDNDGILDVNEPFDIDGDSVPDRLDLDSDNDGIADANEAGHGFRDLDGNFLMDCPSSAFGANGFCDALETAVDSGQPTHLGLLDSDADLLPDARDLDSDNDSLSDLLEGGSGCPDTNLDGICDGGDDDGDGIRNSLEAPLTVQAHGTANGRPVTDTDSDGAPDWRDLDSDGDNHFDILESKNAGLDLDKNGTIDATADNDYDGIRDVADDSDLDGVPDSVDGSLQAFGGFLDAAVDTDDDGLPDSQDEDSDDDTVWDGTDNCRVNSNTRQEDADGDFIGDACDLDDGREWSLQGGCGGCSSNNSSPAGSLVLMLGVLGMVLGRRRRVPHLASAATALAVVAVPSMVHAQSADQVDGNFATERFQLATDREGIIDVESGSVRRHLELDMGLWLGYQNDPLVLNRTDAGREEVGSVVSDQVGGELLAAIGLWNRGQIGLVIPLVFLQNDSIATGLMAPSTPSGSFALGDIRLVPKLSLLTQGQYGADLALLATLTLPTSSGEGFAGDTNVTFAPALALSRRFDTGLRFGANVGYRFREEHEMVLDLRVDDEVFGAVGVGYDLSKTGGAPVEIDASFALATAADDMFGAFNRNYAEVKGGLSIDVPGPLLAFAAAGFGVAEGWGTPDWRALAGVRVDRGNPEAPPPPRIGDTDKDGLFDDVDRCITEPEDFDTFEDTDGCPDLDDDKDGIPDTSDKCRLEPEDVDQFEDSDGCPENDNDQDKILDVSDKCPIDPEDMDGFQDDDGCPDTDNDQDTVLDADDECKDVAGPVENKGCPWPDKDGDGVIDRFDNCPTWKGKPENNGCALPQLVKITESKLELYETTYFATGKAIIARRSYKMLDQVAAVIKGHPELIIKIEGHTDSVGSNALNLKLSDARAKSVMKYLVKKGVDEARLSAQGFGEDQPVADNKTAKGRSANRRVEFMATRTVETIQQAAPPGQTAPATPPAPTTGPPLEKP